MTTKWAMRRAWPRWQRPSASNPALPEQTRAGAGPMPAPDVILRGPSGNRAPAASARPARLVGAGFKPARAVTGMAQQNRTLVPGGTRGPSVYAISRGLRRGRRGAGAGYIGVMRRQIGALGVPIVDLRAVLVKHLAVNIRGKAVLRVLDHDLPP